MREIKFREFVEHIDSTGGDNNYSYMNYNPQFHGNINEIFASNGIKPLNPLHNKVSYMQYTGLKDKNGKEIYERDITKTTLPKVEDDGSPGEEVFIGVIEFEPHSGWGVRQTEYYSDFIHCDYTEVIGNIFEHPHLLKGE